MKTILLGILIAGIIIGWTMAIFTWQDNKDLGAKLWDYGEGMAGRDEEIDLLKNDLVQYGQIISTTTAQWKECKSELSVWQFYFGEETRQQILKLAEEAKYPIK